MPHGRIMKNEIIIGLGGLILLVLTYFAGVWRTESRHSQLDKRERMDAVYKSYMSFRHSGKTAGHDGLQKSGVATLVTDKEIRELADRIMAHGEADPLERQSGLLDSIDLKKYFDYAARERIKFLTVKVEDVIENSKA